VSTIRRRPERVDSARCLGRTHPLLVRAGCRDRRIGIHQGHEWFRIAFIMSIPVLLIWTVISGAWMRVIGIWD